MAVHQPRGADLYRVLGDPQGDGGPLLQDPEPGPGRPGNLRAAGESTSLSPEESRKSECRVKQSVSEFVFLF